MARPRRSPQPNSGRKKTKTQQFPPGGQEYPTSGPVEPVVCTQKRIRAQGEAVWARRHTTADRWLNQWSTQWSLQWRMPDMTKTSACSRRPRPEGTRCGFRPDSPTPRVAPPVAPLVRWAGNVRPHGALSHCGAFAAADHWFHWSTGEEFPAQ